MVNLIAIGNINQFTFANSILVAYHKSLEIFHEKLSNIYIFHSQDSQRFLQSQSDWIEFLEKNDIQQTLFINRIVDIHSNHESINRFISAIEQVIKSGLDDSNLIVDLSNGTSLQKNILSIASYVLNIKHQYMIDVIKLSELTQDRGFLSVNVLLPSYISTPDSTELDRIAYLNLAEIIRYKKIIETHANKYVEIDKENSDFKFFKDNLIHSIKLKLQGDKNQDNAIYRIAASSISSSIEDLITLLIKKFVNDRSFRLEKATLGQKLQQINLKIENNCPQDFDLEFFRKFNDFMLYLRNSTTHKGKILTDLERFKADLSVKMSFPFIEFYIDVIYPILLSDITFIQELKTIQKISEGDIKSDEIIYYGLDGDNTGKVLEELFISSTSEDEFKKVSNSIVKAIDEIKKKITKNSKNNSIIFAAGDDLLFKANLDENMLEDIHNMYCDITSGLTCSIGYGRSLQEVYLALKVAKTQPGKNSIIGIQIT